MNGEQPVTELKAVSARLANPGACNGCALCVYRCLTGNIKLREGKPAFGSECVACGHCVEVCNRGALALAVEEERRW